MRTRLLAPLALVVMALVPGPRPAADASCAPPVLEVRGAEGTPVLLARGTEVTVTGRGFVDGCDDTRVESSFGCSGSDEAQPPTPSAGVELVLLRGRPTMTQTPLGVADATSTPDEPGLVTWTFTVPARHPLGPGVLKTEGSEPLRVRVVR